MKLPLHFSKEIVEYSATALEYGINNSAPADVLKNAEALFTNVLVPLRIRLTIKFAKPIPIYINSWYRCPELNSHPKIKGSKTSQHLSGKSVDTFVVGVSFDKYYQAVKELILGKKLPVDQCIKEYGKNPDSDLDDWLHISHNPNGANRYELLIKKPGEPYIKDVT